MAASTLIDIMVPIISYLIDNRRDLFEIVLAVHAVAMLIVNLTPSPKDNEAVGAVGAMLPKFYRALEVLAGIVFPMAKR